MRRDTVTDFPRNGSPRVQKEPKGDTARPGNRRECGPVLWQVRLRAVAQVL